MFYDMQFYIWCKFVVYRIRRSACGPDMLTRNHAKKLTVPIFIDGNRKIQYLYIFINVQCRGIKKNNGRKKTAWNYHYFSGLHKVSAIHIAEHASTYFSRSCKYRCFLLPLFSSLTGSKCLLSLFFCTFHSLPYCAIYGRTNLMIGFGFPFPRSFHFPTRRVRRLFTARFPF